jgi:excisionase family DNA binding protein
VTADQVELLSIPDVAQRLKVSRNQVYQLIKKHGLPACLVGNVLRVRLVKLQDWIEQREHRHAS